MNLDQIRARNALACEKKVRDAAKDSGDALSGYGTLIISNGLMAALAFSMEKEGQHLAVADAVAYHLANLDGTNLLCRHSNAQDSFPKTGAGLRDKLAKDSDATHLRRCTDEALAFVGFLKRFVKAKQ